ncbi:MAG: hypothetical protein VKJ09_10610 [Leptolyngbya sp.]|nr:hypothetical protein [Leptolyngbya sp.]
MKRRSHLRLRHPWVLGGLITLVSVAPVLAQTANFGSLVLSTFPARGQSVDGRTAGSYALSNIATTDKDGNLCVGYGDVNPDHILVLENDFPSLTLTVDSGEDTTLLIQGPNDNTIRCGQDISRSNPDADISDENWPAGTYRVWVGTHNQGQRHSYTLSADE